MVVVNRMLRIFIRFLKIKKVFQLYIEKVKSSNKDVGYIFTIPIDQLISGCFIWDDDIWIKINTQWRNVIYLLGLNRNQNLNWYKENETMVFKF